MARIAQHRRAVSWTVLDRNARKQAQSNQSSGTPGEQPCTLSIAHSRLTGLPGIGGRALPGQPGLVEDTTRPATATMRRAASTAAEASASATGLGSYSARLLSGSSR